MNDFSDGHPSTTPLLMSPLQTVGGSSDGTDSSLSSCVRSLWIVSYRAAQEVINRIRLKAYLV